MTEKQPSKERKKSSKQEKSPHPAKKLPEKTHRSDLPPAKSRLNLNPDKVDLSTRHQSSLGFTEVTIEAEPQLYDQIQPPHRRDSFVVRVTLDENNQFGRTEIKHISSNKKHNFPTLDGESLVAFMKSCTRQEILAQLTIPAVQIHSKGIGEPQEQPKNGFNVHLSEIQLLNTNGPAAHFGLSLPSEKPFIVLVRFQLEGEEALFLTDQKPLFEIKLLLNDIASGKSRLLTTQHAQLSRNVLEYTMPIEVLGLAPGLYRLLTMITIDTVVKAASYYDGPIIQVI